MPSNDAGTGSGAAPDKNPDGPVAQRAPGLPDAQTLRPGSSIAVGVTAGLAGLALLVPTLLSPDRSWPLISSVVLGLVLLWLFVVRPAAKLQADGIRLVNPLRVVDVTWPAIDEVRSKWALELVCAGRKYTAWGIPADPARPRYGRGMFAISANRVSPGVAPPERRPKIIAQTVAAEVEARIEADRRRKDGRTPKVVTQWWDPSAVALLLGGVAFFVIAVFVA